MPWRDRRTVRRSVSVSVSVSQRLREVETLAAREPGRASERRGAERPARERVDAVGRAAFPRVLNQTNPKDERKPEPPMARGAGVSRHRASEVR